VTSTDDEDEKEWGDEVIVPDEVDGQRRAVDRRPLYAMIAGLSSLIFLVFIPIPVLMLALAIAGIYLGRKVMKEIGRDESRAKDRRRAKFGFVGGSTTLVLFAILVVVLTVVYEPPDKGVEVPEDRSASSEPAG
jgi:hypothetical protein